jgi:hypothetical protein
MHGKFWLVGLGIVASLISIGLIANDYRGIVDVFELADPTGGGGVYFLGGLLANLVVVFVTLGIVLQRSPSAAGFGWAAIALAPSLLVAIAALPCFIAARPGALCGVGAVFVLELGIPVVLAAGAAFAVRSPGKAVKLAAVGGVAVFLACVEAAWAHLTPAEPGQCRELEDVGKTGNCLRVFATRAGDANLCRAIEFRTTRFTGLREVALAKQQPLLCAEIRDASPVEAWEAPAAFYRDTCFQNIAYALHDRGQCANIADEPLRQGCEPNLR